ncbi:methyl-accepting chemotaxis protein [Salinicola rhizosphaerae]|uniref:Methyl-accepting chemotaxis protein n=1 Tax=Salinicola rhizosphaerae TaxID=1443141 RepID=A0ABQ3E680_9GAMM|nr:methyl-accepting chemotaxis protein [Salinicola rhizosphaerae]GHB20824.1 methyl-accepting chemotaxis protein [Salinicola rhizosphaerae]
MTLPRVPLPRFTLRSGLIAMLVIFALLLAAVGGGSYFAMKQAQSAFDAVYALNVQRLGTAREVYADLMQTRVLLDSYQTDYNRLRVKPAKKTWANATATFEQAKTALSDLPVSAAAASASDQESLEARFQALIDSGIQPGFDALKAWDVSAYQQSVAQANELTSALDTALATLTDRGRRTAEAGAAAMARNVDLMQFGIPAALGFTALVIGFAFFMLQRHLLRPLGEVQRHLANIAEGNLGPRLTLGGVSEMRRLKEGVDTMQGALHGLVSQLQTGSVALRGDASNLSEASHALTDESQQQAQALQQTSASMAQITATVAQTAEHAEQGCRLAADSRRQLDGSGRQVDAAITEMQRARSRSQASLEVISMIDSLAFQTNLLALNASVEAARAGSQGRGFAVVAEEVRSLSARSAQAARTIREQIEGTHRQVQQGTDELASAGQTLAKAIASSERLGELLDGITLSCQQQRDGIHQIDQAIHAIDAATQRNATLAERTRQATRELDARAALQREQVGRFRLTIVESQKITALSRFHADNGSRALVNSKSDEMSTSATA